MKRSMLLCLSSGVDEGFGGGVLGEAVEDFSSETLVMATEAMRDEQVLHR